LIGGDLVTQNAEPELFARLVEPADPVPAVASELEQKLPPMAALGDVPDVAGEPMAIPLEA
jgi:hypothetical protein